MAMLPWYKTAQLVILLFAMCLMLSKSYVFFENIFSVFYEGAFSIICVVVGTFSVLHGLFMMFRSFWRKEE